MSAPVASPPGAHRGRAASRPVLRSGDASLALAVALVGATVLALLATGRGIAYAAQDWALVAGRTTGSLGSLFDPVDKHLALVPLALLRVTTAAFGIAHAAVVLRVLAGVADGAVGLLVFALVRSRAGWPWGLLAAASVAFCGSAWETLLSPVGVGDVDAVGFGLGALRVAESASQARRRDALVALLLTASLASSRFGLAAVVHVGVLLALRGRWSRLWAPAVALAAELAWLLAAGDLPARRANASHLVGWSVKSLASEAGAVVGLGRAPGAVLVVALVVGVALAARAQALTPRAIAAGAAVLAWVVATELARDPAAAPDSSRLLFGGVVLLVLLAAELVPPVRQPTRAVTVAAALVAALLALAGVVRLRDGARSLRAESDSARAELAVLGLTGGRLPATTTLDGRLLPGLTVGRWEASVARVGGSPALAPTQLLGPRTDIGPRADELLRQVHAAGLGPSRASAPGPGPIVDSGVGVRSRHGSCVRLAGGAPRLLAFAYPGLAVRPGRAGVDVAAGRFSSPAPIARIEPRRPQTLFVQDDPAPAPWQVQVDSARDFDVCVAAG